MKSVSKIKMTRYLLIFCLIFGFIPPGRSFPDPGRFSLTLNDSQQYSAIVKNVYNQTKIFVKIRCEPQSESNEIDQKPFVQIGWVLRETTCWNEYAFLDSPDQSQDLFPTYYNKPDVRLDLPGYSNHTNYARLNQTQHQCDNVITLPEVKSLIRLV